MFSSTSWSEWDPRRNTVPKPPRRRNTVIFRLACVTCPPPVDGVGLWRIRKRGRKGAQSMTAHGEKGATTAELCGISRALWELAARSRSRRRCGRWWRSTVDGRKGIDSPKPTVSAAECTSVGPCRGNSYKESPHCASCLRPGITLAEPGHLAGSQSDTEAALAAGQAQVSRWKSRPPRQGWWTAADAVGAGIPSCAMPSLARLPLSDEGSAAAACCQYARARAGSPRLA